MLFHVFWYDYWWASIKGNAPEDGTSLIVVTVIASIVVPRIRRWWKDRAEQAHAAERHLVAKLDHVMKTQAHIIKHHDGISNLSHDGEDLTVVPEELLGHHDDH